jgi:hypothetical protein
VNAIEIADGRDGALEPLRRARRVYREDEARGWQGAIQQIRRKTFEANVESGPAPLPIG